MRFLIPILLSISLVGCAGIKVAPLTKPQIIRIVQLDLIALDEVAIALTKTSGQLHISVQSQLLIHDFVVSARVAIDSYQMNADTFKIVTASLATLTTNLSSDLRTNQTVRDILLGIGMNLEKLV
jgi:hypothetical protein